MAAELSQLQANENERMNRDNRAYESPVGGFGTIPWYVFVSGGLILLFLLLYLANNKSGQQSAPFEILPGGKGKPWKPDKVVWTNPIAPNKSANPGPLDPQPFPLNYTVQQGDTLQSISQHFYGVASLSTLILQDNVSRYPTIGRGLTPGWSLLIPRPPY